MYFKGLRRSQREKMTLRQVHEIGEAVLKLEGALFPCNKTYKTAIGHLAAA